MPGFSADAACARPAKAPGILQELGVKAGSVPGRGLQVPLPSVLSQGTAEAKPACACSPFPCRAARHGLGKDKTHTSLTLYFLPTYPTYEPAQFIPGLEHQSGYLGSA